MWHVLVGCSYTHIHKHLCTSDVSWSIFLYWFHSSYFSDAAETETCSFWIGWLATRVPDIPGDATLSPRAEVKSTPAMFDFYMGAGKSPLKLSWLSIKHFAQWTTSPLHVVHSYMINSHMDKLQIFKYSNSLCSHLLQVIADFLL